MNPIAAAWQDVVVRFLVWLLAAIDRALGGWDPTQRVGALALAIVVTTAILRVGLFPLAAVFTALRGRRRRTLSMLAWPVASVSLLVQVLVTAALYYAIADVARAQTDGHLGFAGIGNITNTALDVCCTVTRDGSQAVDAGGAPQHGDYIAGLIHNPGAVAVPVIAGLFAVLQATIGRSRKARMSPDQRAVARATQQTAGLSALMIVVAASLLPEAVALAMASQSACLYVQGKILARWSRKRGTAAVAPLAGLPAHAADSRST